MKKEDGFISSPPANANIYKRLSQKLLRDRFISFYEGRKGKKRLAQNIKVCTSHIRFEKRFQS